MANIVKDIISPNTLAGATYLACAKYLDDLLGIEKYIKQVIPSNMSMGGFDFGHILGILVDSAVLYLLFGFVSGFGFMNAILDLDA